MKSKFQPCDVCGHSDVETIVHNSPAGPLSARYCVFCSAMMAEDAEILDVTGANSCCIYDTVTDTYVDFDSKEPKYITFKDGKKLLHRADAVTYNNNLIKSKTL